MLGVVSVFAPVQDALDDVFRVLHLLRVRRHVEAPGRQRQVRVVLGFRPPPLDVADAVADHRQRTLGRLRRVLLPQRTGRRVAGVGESALARRRTVGVEPVEFTDGNVDLAADLEHVGNRVLVGKLEFMRDVGDGAGVGGDVLADAAVAPSRRPDQAALFVYEIDGQAVDLEFRQIRRRRGAGQPVPQLGLVEDVVQAVQALEVLDRLEGHPVGGRVHAGADLLSGAVRHGELRVLRLHLLQPAKQRVVLGVGDDRLAGVVLRRMVADLCRQLLPRPPHLGAGGLGRGSVGQRIAGAVGDGVDDVFGGIGHGADSRRSRGSPSRRPPGHPTSPGRSATAPGRR